MNTKKTVLIAMTGAACSLAVFTACGKSGNDAKDVSSRSSETSVATNDNGSVSRSFVESTVSTNGNMVTERRRETRTTTDTDGNVLETSTSEYAQSYPVGDVGFASFPSADEGDAPEGEPADNGTFLGIRFGETVEGEFERDGDEPTLLRTKFSPKKALEGFDDYYVYVTPKTHKAAKVYACAKQAVENGARARRHYLVEALEKRYRTWARLCSYRRPCYAFNIGDGRHVTACLLGASRDYETVVAAWDSAMENLAADEQAELIDEERKSAAEKRSRRVNDAVDAF